MTLRAAACAIAKTVTAFNRNPIVLLALVPFCVAFIAVGSMFLSIDKAVWVLTLLLSIDASLQARAVLFDQGPESGDGS